MWKSGGTPGAILQDTPPCAHRIGLSPATPGLGPSSLEARGAAFIEQAETDRSARPSEGDVIRKHSNILGAFSMSLASLLGFVEASHTQESRVTAINILLEPDATMVQHARADNARVLEAYPTGFALDPTHQPHLTLIQQFVRTAHAGYDIASGLLRTYLGNDAGSRVHSGAVERGTVDSLLSVLWYADLRGFTRISDVSSGAEIVHMLNDVFETLTAALRPRGGHVLKFIGDAMLATISFDEPDEKVACRRALDAAVEASSNLKARNLEREAAGLPFADVDIALHVGEVLYGNVGAADRLDFTVIGPAVNEVVRIEKLCERLNRQILFSSRFAEAAGRCDGRLELLGQFELRGVGEHKEIFGLRLPPTAALQLASA